MKKDERLSIARQIRSDIISMAGYKDVSTVALSFASVELLVHLYDTILSRSSQKPDDPLRDRVVLSDQIMVPTQYAVLSHNRFFAREHLWACSSLGSVLQGVANDLYTPGIDMPGGMPSLSLAAAWGMAKARAIRGITGQLWCVLGPRALQSEEFWHSAATLSAWGLNNLSLLLCCVEEYEEVCSTEKIAHEMMSLGWTTTCCDGHDFDAMDRLSMKGKTGQVFLFSCQYGRGLSFLKERSPKDSMSRELRERALSELNGVKEKEESTWLL